MALVWIHVLTMWCYFDTKCCFVGDNPLCKCLCNLLMPVVSLAKSILNIKKPILNIPPCGIGLNPFDKLPFTTMTPNPPPNLDLWRLLWSLPGKSHCAQWSAYEEFGHQNGHQNEWVPWARQSQIFEWLQYVVVCMSICIMFMRILQSGFLAQSHQLMLNLFYNDC